MIIDRGPGVEVKYLYGLMGTRGGGTGRVVFRDVKVPKRNLIGPLHGGGAGLQHHDDPRAPVQRRTLPGRDAGARSTWR